MKMQFLMKQVCGLSIMVAGALVPFSSAQAADELSDRYLNGYLNDPYSNEVAPETRSVLRRGAEGPIRTEISTADELSDRYLNGYLNDPYTNEVAPDTKSVLSRGAEGPIRTDASIAEDPADEATPGAL